MIRTSLLCLLALALAAVEYDPAPERTVFYTWKTDQSAQWKSAGDTLRYDTSIVWHLALRCAAVDGPRMTLAATFIKVEATHRGPGTDIRVHSPSGAGADDPLLGHLIVLAGKTLTFEVERATGRVASVTGGDAVIDAINRRSPAAVPGDPPPLDAQAKAAYGPDALARLWSQILALPTATADPVALPAPFTGGSMVRTWKDRAWTVETPTGPPVTFELAKDPTPVQGTLGKLSGGGSIELSAGMPARASGKLAFTLAITAMTQPIETANEITWTLETIVPK